MDGLCPEQGSSQAAAVAHAMRSADRFGLPSWDPPIDFGLVIQHVRASRERIYSEADAPPKRISLCQPYQLVKVVSLSHLRR